MVGLEIAMAQGYGVMVRKMLKAIPLKKRNALLSKTDEKGWTLLHKAAQSSSAEVINAILSYFPTPEKKLAAIRQFTKKDETPLHLAVRSANCANVTALLDAHSSDDERLQTLTYASLQNKPIFPRLASLPTDADRYQSIAITNQQGSTLLHLATARAGLLNYLQAYYPSATARLQTIESMTSSGEDVLSLAAEYYNYDSVKLLLRLYPPHERWMVVHRSRQPLPSLRTK